MDEEAVIKRHMAAIARQRPRTLTPCAVCGTPFPAISWGRYCSTRCRMKASSARRKARRKSPPTLPTIESLGGSDPDFTGELSTAEYMRSIRGELSTDEERDAVHGRQEGA